MPRSYLICLFFLLGVACSKTTPSGNTASPSTSGNPSSASSSCASISGLSGLTDKGTTLFSGNKVQLQAHNDNGQYYFAPTCARAHGAITVTIKNVGDTLHNFSIASMNIDKDIQKGATISVSVSLPTSGVVTFFCKYHKSSGMQGAFIISGR